MNVPRTRAASAHAIIASDLDLGATAVQPNADPWSSLEKSFLDAVANTNTTWIDLWGMVVEHPAFVGMATAVARATTPRNRSDRSYWQEEVVQFLRLRFGQKLRNRRDLRFDPTQGTLHTWLNRLATNECRSFWRQQRCWRHVPMPADELVVDCSQPGRGPRQLTHAEVRASIEILEEPSRTLLKLILAGKTQREIGESLALTVAQIRRRKDKAMQQLRRLLEHRERK